MPTIRLESLSQNLAQKLTTLYNNLPTEPVNKKYLYSEVVSFFNELPRTINLINGRFTGRIIRFFLSKVNLAKWINLLMLKQSDTVAVASKLQIIFQAFSQESTHPIEKEIAHNIVDFLDQINNDEIITEIFSYVDKFWFNINPIIEHVIFPTVIPTQSKENQENIELINHMFEIAIASCESKDTQNREKQKRSVTEILIIINKKLMAAGYPKVLTTIISSYTNNILNSEIHESIQGQILRFMKKIINQILSEGKIDRNLILNDTGKPQSYVLHGIKLALVAAIPILKDIIKIEEDRLEKIKCEHKLAYEKLTELVKGPTSNLTTVNNELLKGITISTNSNLSTTAIILTDLSQQLVTRDGLINNNTIQSETIVKLIKQLSTKQILLFRQRLNTKLNEDNHYATELKIKYDKLLSILVELASISIIENLDALEALHSKLETIITQANSLLIDIQKNAQEDNTQYRLFVKRDIGPVFGDISKNGARLWSINNAFNITNPLEIITKELSALQILIKQQIFNVNEIKKKNVKISELRSSAQNQLDLYSTEIKQANSESINTSQAYPFKIFSPNNNKSKPRSLLTIIILRIIRFPYYFIKNTIKASLTLVTSSIKSVFKIKSISDQPLDPVQPQVAEQNTEAQHYLPTDIPPIAESRPLSPIKKAKSVSTSTPTTQSLMSPIIQAQQAIHSPSHDNMAEKTPPQSLAPIAPITPSAPILTMASKITHTNPMPSEPSSNELALDTQSIIMLTSKIKKIDLDSIIKFRKRLNTSNNNGVDICKEDKYKPAYARSKANADILKQRYDELIFAIKSLINLSDATSNPNITQPLELSLSNINSLISFIENIIKDSEKNENFRLFVERILRDDLGYSNRSKGGTRLSTINEDFDLLPDLYKLKKQFLSIAYIIQNDESEPELLRSNTSSKGSLSKSSDSKSTKCPSSSSRF